MTKTELYLQYYECTRHFDLPDIIEQALEEDFIKNYTLYSDEMFKCIQLHYLISQNITPKEMINYVHEFNENA